MSASSAKRSSIKTFSKYNSALVGNAFTNPYTANFEHISTISLTSSQATISFSNLNTIAADYKHLQIRFTTRNDYSQSASDIYLRINGDSTAANYAYHALYGTGSAAGSEASLGAPTGARLAQSAGGTFTSGVYFAGISDILDFSSLSKYKTIRTFSGNTGTYDRFWLASNLWMSTAAITSLTFILSVGSNFVSGTRISIYGSRG